MEHVLAMLAAGDTPETILQEYTFLEAEDIQACLVFAHRFLAGEQKHETIAGQTSIVTAWHGRKQAFQPPRG